MKSFGKTAYLFQIIALLFVLVSLSGFQFLNTPGNQGHLPDQFIVAGQISTFEADNFKARRAAMLEALNGRVAIITAAAEDDFYYLTGFDEKQGVAILHPNGKYPFTLFVAPRDPTHTLWDGPLHGTEGAMNEFRADMAYDIAELGARLPDLLLEGVKISVLKSEMQSLKAQLESLLPSQVLNLENDLTDIVHEMRVNKDSWEQALLTRAVDVTINAHKRALQSVKPGLYEYDIKAEIEYVFNKNNCKPGYNSIVGSGPNAAILHYVKYDRQLQDGDLLLMDVGAEFNGYTADVTRTIPVNGKFTAEQRELYQLVLNAMEAGIKKMKPGYHMLDCHHAATEVMVNGLYDLGLILDKDSWWQKRFYIHYRNTHYIGLYVHDVGSYGKFNPGDRNSYLLDSTIKGRALEPGMVLTIEPGVYLIEDRLEHLHSLFGGVATPEELDAFAAAIRPVYEKYAGIGIRIEDNVLITETGNVVLSEDAPKTIENIEKWMN
jgi:Xaa-Pro aminopeptidase